MTDELKPYQCPICGKHPNTWYHVSGYGVSNVCDVYCKQDNHSIVVTGDSKAEAIAAWNARHEPDTLPAWVIEAITERMDFTGAISNTGIMHNDNATAAFNAALEWCLSLRKPEEK